VVLYPITMRTFRVTTHYILRRGTTIHPHHYTLSLISLSVWVEDVVVMIYIPSIEVIVELGVLTLLSYITLPKMVVRYSLNTLGLSTMNLVRL
jgi:hypothetical protein